MRERSECCAFSRRYTIDGLADGEVEDSIRENETSGMGADMISAWSNEDIEEILLQLDVQGIPFNKYTVMADNGKPCRLGSGSSANVYRAWTRDRKKSGYAIKVVGFGDAHSDSEIFQRTVRMQSGIWGYGSNIVRIYDSVQVRVWIKDTCTVTKVEEITIFDEEKQAGDFLLLQFIVMEELVPVITRNKSGQPVLMPGLDTFWEKEIVKLAYDIGIALAGVHSRKMLHRDVKLENIFYSPKERCYKLGDFGIARKTGNGLASTVAFTKGYGAPEVVGTLEDKYDTTADIYSFGMLLYVLLNELCFPGSVNYHPNVMQYQSGFVPQYPIGGSDDLCEIVLKMMRYDPDDRYQSIDEVLSELDQIRYGRMVKYQREHKSAPLVVGSVFALVGSATYVLAFSPERAIKLSVLPCIFLLLCIIKGVLCVCKKEHIWVTNVILLGVGIYLTMATGFTWWKLVLCLFLSLLGNAATGLIGGSLLLAGIVSQLLYVGVVSDHISLEYKWITVLLLSLSVVLVFYCSVLEDRDEIADKMYLLRNKYWYGIALLYLSLLLYRFLYDHNMTEKYFWAAFLQSHGGKVYGWLVSKDAVMVGVFGAIFCLLWVVREKALAFYCTAAEKSNVAGRL